jgi:iron complex outermembrane recepter protein
MKRFIIILLVLMPIALKAQYLVQGTVLDAEDEKPLIGANIVVRENKGTLTDENGQFSLELDQLKPIKISFVGYQTKKVAPDANGWMKIALDPKIELEEVVIKTVRAEQNIPVTQSTIEKQELEKIFIGQDALFALEDITPSLITYSESGTNFSNYGQMRLRGINQTRINITLNGVPLNDMIDQGVFFSNFIDFGNSVESVQVQRGVGTSTNGTSSYAGSINFESINLSNAEPSAEAQLMAGSFNTLRASGEVNSGKINDKFAFYTRFTRMTSDGYRYNTSTDAWSFFFSGAYFGKKDMLKITGFTGTSRNGLAYLPVTISDIEDDPRTNYLNENDIDEFGQDMVQLQHTHWFNKGFSLVSTAYYGGAGGDFPSTFPGEDGSLKQKNFPLINDHYGVMSYFNYDSPDNDFNLSGGFHTYRFERVNQEILMPNLLNPYYKERSHKEELSAFAKANYQIGQLNIYGDVQFRTLQLDINPDDNYLPEEENVVKNWSFINPKLGLNFQINNNQSLYAFFGRSGREPTKVDILGGFTLGSYNIASVRSDEVKPEYVNNLEIGYKLSAPFVTMQTNLFYMDFENEIAPIGEYVPEGFIQLSKNIPRSYRAGIEVDWQMKLLTNLSFSGNGTYMKSQIDVYAPEGDAQEYENVTQPLSPEWMSGATLSYLFKDIIEIGLSAQGMSQSYLEPTNQKLFTMPGFLVFNAQARVMIGKHELSLFANNIFDQQYFTYGAPVDTNEDQVFDQPGFFVQPPRHFYGILKLRF